MVRAFSFCAMKELDFRQKAMLYILRMDCIKSIEQAVELTHKKISISQEESIKGVADYILSHAINAGHDKVKGVRMLWKEGGFSRKRKVYSVIRELSEIAKIIDISDIYEKFSEFRNSPHATKIFIKGISVSANYYVYIIKCQEYYKIGYTKDLRNRISIFITGNPLQLDLFGVFATNENKIAMNFEKQLHIQFLDKKHRNEWFCLNEDDLLTISSMQGFSKTSLKH